MNVINKTVLGVFLVTAAIGYAETRQVEEIVVKINFVCPASEELEALKASLPESNRS
jgi:hypothetical protein